MKPPRRDGDRPFDPPVLTDGYPLDAGERRDLDLAIASLDLMTADARGGAQAALTSTPFEHPS